MNHYPSNPERYITPLLLFLIGTLLAMWLFGSGCSTEHRSVILPFPVKSVTDSTFTAQIHHRQVEFKRQPGDSIGKIVCVTVGR